MNGQLGNILNFLAASSALGTAAFGVVDASKAFGGGISNRGFGRIQRGVAPFIAGAGQGGPSAFGRADVLETLKSNWVNGVAKNQQKAIAKSLIRLGLTTGNAGRLADAAGLDPQQLESSAACVRSGQALTQQDLNLLGRFDVIVSAVLDEAYERADQQYRNASKLASAVTAVILAVIAGALIFAHNSDDWHRYFSSSQILVAILVGLVSTPLAPVAKDLSTAIAAAVKAVGTARV